MDFSSSCRSDCRQRGVTLVELMIAMVLGLVVVGAATALLLSTKNGYAAQDDIARIQEGGAYAIESLGRAIRQAAYVDWGADGPITSNTPGIGGYDARRIFGGTSASSGVDAPLADQVVNGSDVLVVRFFGSGTGSNGDGTIVDCSGMGVPAALPAGPVDEARGTSIFYVAMSGSGEPELYCRSRGASQWTSQSLVRGVESFQVLYGFDTDGDSLPNSFLNATAIHAMGDAQAWNKVVSIKFSLLLRGSRPAREDVLTMVYDLFGKGYGDRYAASDLGTRIGEAALPAATRNRLRKVFTATIQLRNQSGGA